jgi:glutaredoxin-related protein
VDEDKFTVYMKQAKKPPATIKGYANSIKLYEDFLQKHEKVNCLEDSQPKNLKAFVDWGTEKGENVYRHFWGIRVYYEFIQRPNMDNKVREWMEYLQNETRKLREFPKVDKNSVKKLSAMGISTVNQFIQAANTPEKREILSQESGAPLEAILELYKLSELSRLPGLKKVRGRLFYEGGLDSLSVIAAMEAEEVHTTLQEYIDRTGFDGLAPTVGEAQLTIDMAKFLLEEAE